jgi:hypothetical protein
MRWAEFEAAAPELAKGARQLLDTHGIALLGTLRRDGFPRISPIEPHFVRGHLLLGAMARSWKARDLRRDARCTLHSAICAPDAGESELKLYGHAVEVVDPELRAAAVGAWWVSHPPERAYVVSFDLQNAALVEWDLERGELTATQWSPSSGVARTTRPYP